MATPFMSLDLPVVSTTIGPTWASQLNTALEAIDDHDHSSGNGRRITPSGLNITSDLDINDNGVICIGKATMTQLAAAISDQVSLYVVTGDLFYNDASGNSIQLTSAGAINISSTGGIGGDYGTGSSLVSYSATTQIYTFTDDAGNRAGILAGNLDLNSREYHNNDGIAINTVVTNADDLFIILVDSAADSSITVTLPPASVGERLLHIKDVGGATDVVITIAPDGTDTVEGLSTDLTITAPYGSVQLTSDGTSAWWVL